MRETHEIVLASTNLDKLAEFQQIFSAYGQITILPAHKIIRNSDKLAHVENFATFEENALAKARLANHAAHYPSLGDDSGLMVEALNGQPGVHTRRYAIPKAGQSQDQANMQKLLDALKGHPMSKRSATFVCSLALVMEGMTLQTKGILNGTIAEAPQGRSGFGYDPIFIPEGFQRTLAELTADEKNEVSHRARAVHELMKQVQTHGLRLAKP